eukprot:6517173-Prymnesium_polylepis.2
MHLNSAAARAHRRRAAARTRGGGRCVGAWRTIEAELQRVANAQQAMEAGRGLPSDHARGDTSAAQPCTSDPTWGGT